MSKRMLIDIKQRWNAEAVVVGVDENGQEYLDLKIPDADADAFTTDEAAAIKDGSIVEADKGFNVKYADGEGYLRTRFSDGVRLEANPIVEPAEASGDLLETPM